MKKKLLEVKNLNVNFKSKDILKNFNLSILENETHIIMGPNGSGKSTLAKVLAGDINFNILSGKIFFENRSILKLTTEERLHKGIFLGFQAPVEIPGINNFDFYRLIYNLQQKNQKKNEVNPIQFINIINPLLQKLNISNEFLSRNLNEGFSGGEKKKNEILQMLLLKPKLAILDEIDSGLDIDALKLVCDELKKDTNTSYLIITHYPAMIEYLKPANVHIFMEGSIKKSGNFKLLDTLKKNGYEYFKNI